MNILSTVVIEETQANPMPQTGKRFGAYIRSKMAFFRGERLGVLR